MRLRIWSVLTALLSLGACGADVAVTTGHVAEMEAMAAEQGQKQKEIAVERLNEATRLMEEQRKGMEQAMSPQEQ
ncbi:MAG: hypothetical protein LBQ75_03465 [Zoogloeaceae bacterium]|nr:hypothetical protein [Zoogloeaceae bacterium]